MNAPTFLLVEDDPDIQINLRAFFEQEGYPIHIVGNGQEAFAYLESGNSVRAILLDLMMPVMDGYEFLERFFSESKKPYSGIPVILLSASPDLVRVATERNLAYVTKPIDLERLIDVLGPV